jgi:integrase
MTGPMPATLRSRVPCASRVSAIWVGDLRRSDDGAVIHVRGKGGKDRRIPIEPALVDILERYLDSRAARFPAAAKGAPPPAGD